MDVEVGSLRDVAAERMTGHRFGEAIGTFQAQVPAPVRRPWQRCRELLVKVTAAGLVMALTAAAAHGQGPAHRPPRPGDTRGAPATSPATRPVSPGKPADVDATRSGRHGWGRWRYLYRVGRPGTVSERRSGLLAYGGRLILGARMLDRIWTPWGIMQYFGQGQADAGWLLGRVGDKPLDLKKGRMLPTPVKVVSVPGAAAEPTTKPAKHLFTQPQIDPARSGSYKWDQWEYVYTVRNTGTDKEIRSGRLVCIGRPIPAPKLNDRMWTPWGVMQHLGGAGPETGWLLRGARDRPLDLKKGKLLPSPVGRLRPLHAKKGISTVSAPR